MPRQETPSSAPTLDAAAARYCQAFGEDALPCLCGVAGAAEATAIAEATGLPQPPLHGAL